MLHHRILFASAKRKTKTKTKQTLTNTRKRSVTFLPPAPALTICNCWHQNEEACFPCHGLSLKPWPCPLPLELPERVPQRLDGVSGRGLSGRCLAKGRGLGASILKSLSRTVRRPPRSGEARAWREGPHAEAPFTTNPRFTHGARTGRWQRHYPVEQELQICFSPFFALDLRVADASTEDASPRFLHRHAPKGAGTLVHPPNSGESTARSPRTAPARPRPTPSPRPVSPYTAARGIGAAAA